MDRSHRRRSYFYPAHHRLGIASDGRRLAFTISMRWPQWCGSWPNFSAEANPQPVRPSTLHRARTGHPGVPRPGNAGVHVQRGSPPRRVGKASTRIYHAVEWHAEVRNAVCGGGAFATACDKEFLMIRDLMIRDLLMIIRALRRHFDRQRHAEDRALHSPAEIDLRSRGRGEDWESWEAAERREDLRLVGRTRRR